MEILTYMIEILKTAVFAAWGFILFLFMPALGFAFSLLAAAVVRLARQCK